MWLVERTVGNSVAEAGGGHFRPESTADGTSDFASRIPSHQCLDFCWQPQVFAFIQHRKRDAPSGIRVIFLNLQTDAENPLWKRVFMSV